MKDVSFDYYVTMLREFMDENIVKIDWGKNKQGINISKAAKEKIDKSEYPITEDEFVEVSFEIIYICIALSNGSISINDFDVEKVETVTDNFLSSELKDEINIKTSSSSSIIEELNYQILTKRNKKQPKDIITYSILLELLTSEPQLDTGSNKKLENIKIELSKSNIEELIKSLTHMREDLEKINSDE